MVPIPLAGETSQRAIRLFWDGLIIEFAFNLESMGKRPARQGILSNLPTPFDLLVLVAPWCLPEKQILQKLYKWGPS